MQDGLTDLVSAAEGYLALGLPIIALTGKAPNGKVHPHGLTDALGPDSVLSGHGLPGALRTLFCHPQTTGIGLVIPYPYFVIDIDGEEGAETWRALVGDEHFLPTRWVAKTGRGLHLWYSNTEATPSMKLGNLLDLKGQGGYVAAPPSLHPDGHRYTWLLEPDPDEPPMEAPDAVLARIRDHNFTRERAIVRKRVQRRVRHQPFEGGRLWASFGFDHLYERMRNEPSGNRNNLLLWVAATMQEEGATEDEFAMLLKEVKDLGYAAKRTIASGRKRAGG